MEIVNHPLCTASIAAPSDMPESCAALPVRYEPSPDGIFAVSFWKLNADELADVVKGGCVTLAVRAIGRQHPVVSLSVIAPQPEWVSFPEAALTDADRFQFIMRAADNNGGPEATALNTIDDSRKPYGIQLSTYLREQLDIVIKQLRGA